MGAQPQIDLERSGDGARLHLGGPLRIATLHDWQAQAMPEIGHVALVIDIRDVVSLDTAGAWFLLDLERRLAAGGAEVSFDGMSAKTSALMEIVRDNLPRSEEEPEAKKGLTGCLEDLGRTTWSVWRTMLELNGLLGQLLVRGAGLIVQPGRLRWTAMVAHMQAAGLQALPIVALMSFLIGVVMAFQGAVQLRAFGAEIFVVDLLAISILRELGVLLTAILVAGRSGSAFTAAIGSMKMREEIDAMRTLGLDPVEVLVLPRVLALVIMLPILAFFADIAGLLGGALMSWINLGISPGLFLARLLEETDVWNFVVGMVKAPFFAATIGLVGCFEGLKVEGNAESLGARTSRSVVEAIFLVIVLDALFSVFFAIVGV
ncbi:ABC transporter permease [Amaricoccus macauensis]|uniref:ABC transporter permease n=1 Tax=Amaricoccus macauensis TaxID=57001 RepID=UPI003C7DC5C0